MDKQTTASLDEKEYTMLRQSIRDLETEIDEAYDQCHQTPQEVEGIDPSSHRSPTNSQSYEATPVDSTKREPIGASTVPENKVGPKRVAFGADNAGCYVPTFVGTRPLYSSTPTNGPGKTNLPPSYHTRMDHTRSSTPELSGHYREPKPMVMPEPYDGVSSLTFED